MKKHILFLVAGAYLTSCVSSTPNIEPDTSSYNEVTSPESVERVPSSAAGEQVFNHGDPRLSQIDWHDLYAEINALNLRRMSLSADPNAAKNEYFNRGENSFYFTKAGFNQAYRQVMSAKTTKQAFHARENVLDINRDFFEKIRQFSQIKKLGQINPEANPLIEQLMQSINEPGLAESNNFFQSQIGKAATDILKDYVIIVVPGFGSHTIKDFTWPEIVRQANRTYGRPDVRPEVAGPNGTKVPQPFETYYGRAAQVGFDVVHPMGYELGFSMGTDRESGDALALWITKLKKMKAYADKKFILIGYSKGTPISMNAFVRHPDVAESIAAIFTMSGVAQGSIPANTFVAKAYEQTGATSREDLITKLDQKLTQSREAVEAAEKFSKNLLVASGANEQFLNRTEGLAKAILSRGGMVNTDNNREPGEQRKTIEGIVDMSNYESLQWNIKNYNNEKFQKPVSIFNISMVTNVKDFVRPNAGLTTLTPPLIVPQFVGDQLQYSKFSKDDVFLYLTSITGFEESSGGLFDTQVAWLDTKSMALDQRPLSHSLNARQLSMMRSRLAAEGVALPAGFENMKRNELLARIAGQRGGMGNVNFINLADFRGTHWDCAFEGVYKPSLSDTQNYYKHAFPRRAMQVSIIQMLALYKQLGGI